MKLMKASPNLEELHIGRLHNKSNKLPSDDQDVMEPVARHYQRISQLKRLKTLTLSGIEFKNGTFFRDVAASFCFLTRTDVSLS